MLKAGGIVYTALIPSTLLGHLCETYVNSPLPSGVFPALKTEIAHPQLCSRGLGLSPDPSNYQNSVSRG